MSTIFIGIAGGTGSGKTTLTRHLKSISATPSPSSDTTATISGRTARPTRSAPRSTTTIPTPLKRACSLSTSRRSRRAAALQCPVYSYVDHNRTDETVEVFPTKVIIVEGILIFQDPTLRDMFDIKIFVETDADVRILRRALRDIRDRGRTLESVITQYLTTVKPMHEQYVEPSRKYADIIVLEGGHNLVALDMIMQRIASHIASED